MQVRRALRARAARRATRGSAGSRSAPGRRERPGSPARPGSRASAARRRSGPRSACRSRCTANRSTRPAARLAWARAARAAASGWCAGARSGRATRCCTSRATTRSTTRTLVPYTTTLHVLINFMRGKYGYRFECWLNTFKRNWLQRHECRTAGFVSAALRHAAVRAVRPSHLHVGWRSAPVPPVSARRQSLLPVDARVQLGYIDYMDVYCTRTPPRCWWPSEHIRSATSCTL